jgi:hypothetical protein
MNPPQQTKQFHKWIHLEVYSTTRIKFPVGHESTTTMMRPLGLFYVYSIKQALKYGARDENRIRSKM